MKKLTRRETLKFIGAAGAGAGLWSRRGIAAPAVAKGTVLTVSTWGGVTQEAIEKHVGPEFSRATGATLAYDIGSQGSGTQADGAARKPGDRRVSWF